MNALVQLLRENPNCRVTITTSRRRKTPVRPKPEIGDLKLRGYNWFRWDYNRSQGAYLVSRRGKHQTSWHWDREATNAELATAREERRAKRLAKKQNV